MSSLNNIAILPESIDFSPKKDYADIRQQVCKNEARYAAGRSANNPASAANRAGRGAPRQRDEKNRGKPKTRALRLSQ